MNEVGATGCRWLSPGMLIEASQPRRGKEGERFFVVAVAAYSP